MVAQSRYSAKVRKINPLSIEWGPAPVHYITRVRLKLDGGIADYEATNLAFDQITGRCVNMSTGEELADSFDHERDSYPFSVKLVDSYTADILYTDFDILRPDFDKLMKSSLGIVIDTMIANNSETLDFIVTEDIKDLALKIRDNVSYINRPFYSELAVFYKGQLIPVEESIGYTNNDLNWFIQNCKACLPVCIMRDPADTGLLSPKRDYLVYHLVQDVFKDQIYFNFCGTNDMCTTTLAKVEDYLAGRTDLIQKVFPDKPRAWREVLVSGSYLWDDEDLASDFDSFLIYHRDLKSGEYCKRVFLFAADPKWPQVEVINLTL